MSDEGNGFWAELRAMAREAVKDVRQTMNEVMFSHHEHAPEMGTPMNPTPQMVTQDLRGFDAELEASARRGGGRDHDRGLER